MDIDDRVEIVGVNRSCCRPMVVTNKIRNSWTMNPASSTRRQVAGSTECLAAGTGVLSRSRARVFTLRTFRERNETGHMSRANSSQAGPGVCVAGEGWHSGETRMWLVSAFLLMVRTSAPNLSSALP